MMPMLVFVVVMTKKKFEIILRCVVMRLFESVNLTRVRVKQRKRERERESEGKNKGNRES